MVLLGQNLPDPDRVALATPKDGLDYGEMIFISEVLDEEKGSPFLMTLRTVFLDTSSNRQISLRPVFFIHGQDGSFEASVFLRISA